MTGKTGRDKKIEILSDLWQNYRYDSEFEDFIHYNDVGLPMAFLVLVDMVSLNDTGGIFLDETYDLLLASLDADPELEYESLDDLLARFGK